MFQLHLPRYSSATVLKDRLLTAITNAGQRGDGAAQRGSLELDDMQLATDHAPKPTYLLDLQAEDGGHCEDLQSFCARAQCDVRHLARLGVTQMSELVTMDADAVQKGLAETPDPQQQKAVATAAQIGRQKYMAMTESHTFCPIPPAIALCASLFQILGVSRYYGWNR